MTATDIRCRHIDTHTERQPERDTWLVVCDLCGYKLARIQRNPEHITDGSGAREATE